ncbi:MAG: LacI family transcriptional regulator [Chloroflexi bacterium]|nr:LacI family transcriptional regulator [Chloroflexota bacterium]
MPEVTIYEVAEKAGVSIATVSNVLNMSSRVKPATRERVLAVIDELGFVPKAEAIARARKGLGRIGVVAPFTTYPSFTQRLHGVMDVLRDQSHELVVYNQESLAVRHNYLTTLPITGRLDGLIVMSLPFDDELANRLTQSGLETVLLEFSRHDLSSVDIDNVAGGRLAADHLISQGHQVCAFVGEKQVSTLVLKPGTQRMLGYRERLGESGIELNDEYISLDAYGVEQARQQAHRLLSLAKPPTAIFAHSDMQAIGVLKAAKDRKLHVPDDLSVIGFDDLDIAEHFELTTIRQPLFESGQVAVQLLLDRLANREASTRQVQLPLTLVRRGTA